MGPFGVVTFGLLSAAVAGEEVFTVHRDKREEKKRREWRYAPSTWRDELASSTGLISA
jgi:hypothetical protein